MLNFEWIREQILKASERHLKFSIEQIYNTTVSDIFNHWNDSMKREFTECYYPPFDFGDKMIREAWLDKEVIYEKYIFETDPPFGFSQAYDIRILSQMYGYEKKYFSLKGKI